MQADTSGRPRNGQDVRHVLAFMPIAVTEKTLQMSHDQQTEGCMEKKDSGGKKTTVQGSDLKIYVTAFQR